MEELRITLSEGKFRNDHTCDGKNHSPGIGVGSVDTTMTRSLAIRVDDPDAPGGKGFVHWIAWNMEPVQIIPENIPVTPVVSSPVRAVQRKNSFRTIGYSGPCPPRGQTHRYFFRIYGLDTLLDLPGGSTADQLARAMQGHVVQSGEMYITYGR
jgi:Raf kinase inhibitor-like YbhB/YbcL family protein